MQPEMKRFREVWGVPWQCLFVDRRFFPFESNMESRLAVSFGPGQTSDKPIGEGSGPHHGSFVFGLHSILIENGSELNLMDQWIDSFPAAANRSFAAIERGARVHLAEIADGKYGLLCTDEPMLQVLGEITVSRRWKLEDFTPSIEWR